MTNQKVEDPLKSLTDILEPDKRQKYFNGTLEDRHKALSDIELHNNVPIEVRQLFETAKNLSLYSWFVYRFHQVSELISFTALEMALKKRYQLEYPNKKPPMLHGLLEHAGKKKWIVNAGFPSLMVRVTYKAERKKVMARRRDLEITDNEPIYIEPPTEADILAALSDIDMVQSIANTGAKIRNNLAHGSTTLHPNSIDTLQLNAEVINQLFIDTKKRV